MDPQLPTTRYRRNDSDRRVVPIEHARREGRCTDCAEALPNLAEFAVAALSVRGLSPIEPSAALERPVGPANVCFCFTVSALDDPYDQLLDAEQRASALVEKLAGEYFTPAFDLYKETGAAHEPGRWIITFSTP